MHTRTFHRARLAVLAAALVAAVGIPGPARAATRFDFAAGGGVGARFWQTSQWNPGTCTIDVDHTFTKSRPELNTVDAVVFAPGDLGLLGRAGVPVSWGATAHPPTGAKLMVRLVRVGTGCPHDDFAFSGNFAINVPANTRFIVVTAAEGTVQPWFTI